ncbi:hypothetical protein HYQ44_011690 [Verticillium longisporum]|nr:hypothetical protein HYQ44_011690 [Verticillium longisporum]
MICSKPRQTITSGPGRGHCSKRSCPSSMTLERSCTSLSFSLQVTSTFSNLNMQLTQQLGLMALAGTASAFVVDVFSGERCTGQSQNVNVYDNTCAAWMIGYRSFRVKTYGSTPQRAYFCTGGACNNCNSWWAGGSDQFLRNMCISLGSSLHWSAGSFRGLPHKRDEIPSDADLVLGELTEADFDSSTDYLHVEWTPTGTEDEDAREQ